LQTNTGRGEDVAQFLNTGDDRFKQRIQPPLNVTNFGYGKGPGPRVPCTVRLESIPVLATFPRPENLTYPFEKSAENQINQKQAKYFLAVNQLKMRFHAVFMRLFDSRSESINYLKAFTKMAPDYGIQDGYFEGVTGLIFA